MYYLGKACDWIRRLALWRVLEKKKILIRYIVVNYDQGQIL